MYCPGKEFTEPCVFLILKSKSNVCQSLESPIGELSEWAGHAGSFSSIFLQRCSPIAHKQSQDWIGEEVWDFRELMMSEISSAWQK